jgi:hypothetical protein
MNVNQAAELDKRNALSTKLWQVNFFETSQIARSSINIHRQVAYSSQLKLFSQWAELAKSNSFSVASSFYNLSWFS